MQTLHSIFCTLFQTRQSYPTDYWFFRFIRDEYDRQAFVFPLGTNMFTLVLTWGKHCASCTLEAKGPKGRNSLSATPFHSLPPYRRSATVYLSLSNDNGVASYLFFLQHWQNAQPPLHCAILHCDGKCSVWTIWKACQRKIAAVTDTSEPNAEDTDWFGAKCMVNAEFVEIKPCQMNPLPHKINRFFCEWFGTLVMGKDLMGILVK